MTRQKRALPFYCFSPPVMVATFAIEVSIALYTLVRYRLNRESWAIILLLVCLAAFQMAEYFVCTHTIYAEVASRAGYVAITFLPALGLYLMGLLTKPLSRFKVWGIFLLSWLVAAYFLLVKNVFNSYVCTGNYVIFQLNKIPSIAYGVFYYALLAAAIILGILHLKDTQKTENHAAVHWLLAGYAVFIVPVAVLTVFHPDTSQGIPSLLCGFAVLLAIIVGARIAPLTLQKR